MTAIEVPAWSPILLVVFSIVALIAFVIAGFMLRGLKKERNIALVCFIGSLLLAALMQFSPMFVLR